MNATELEEAKMTLLDTERKFRKSCTQINLLNKQLEDTKARYQRAKMDNFHRFRYNLRLKLAVVEGIRNMYYEYAHVQAERVAALRNKLYGEIISFGTEESDDWKSQSGVSAQLTSPSEG